MYGIFYLMYGYLISTNNGSIKTNGWPVSMKEFSNNMNGIFFPAAEVLYQRMEVFFRLHDYVINVRFFMIS
jgi:hypothetical protein